MANVIPPGKICVVDITLPDNERVIRLDPNQPWFHAGVYIHPIIRIKSTLDERRRCLVDIFVNTADGEKLILSYPVGTTTDNGTFMEPYQEFTFYLPNRDIIEVCLQDPGDPFSIFGERTISARVRIDPDYFITNLPYEHDCPPVSCNFSVVQSGPGGSEPSDDQNASDMRLLIKRLLVPVLGVMAGIVVGAMLFSGRNGNSKRD